MADVGPWDSSPPADPRTIIGLIYSQAAVQRGRLTGSGRLVDELALKIERRIELRSQGRPEKNQKESVSFKLLTEIR
jgi:hypothetical protein